MDIFGFQNKGIYFTSKTCAKEIKSLLNITDEINKQNIVAVPLIQSISNDIFKQINETIRCIEINLSNKSKKINSAKNIMTVLINYICLQVQSLCENVNFCRYNLTSSSCIYEYGTCSNNHYISIFFSKQEQS
jgi:hypothetical protein